MAQETLICFTDFSANKLPQKTGTSPSRTPFMTERIITIDIWYIFSQTFFVQFGVGSGLNGHPLPAERLVPAR